MLGRQPSKQIPTIVHAVHAKAYTQATIQWRRDINRPQLYLSTFGCIVCLSYKVHCSLFDVLAET